MLSRARRWARHLVLRRRAYLLPCCAFCCRLGGGAAVRGGPGQGGLPQGHGPVLPAPRRPGQPLLFSAAELRLAVGAVGGGHRGRPGQLLLLLPAPRRPGQLLLLLRDATAARSAGDGLCRGGCLQLLPCGSSADCTAQALGSTRRSHTNRQAVPPDAQPVCKLGLSAHLSGDTPCSPPCSGLPSLQAVTCDDFLAAMADANGEDLSSLAK